MEKAKEIQVKRLKRRSIVVALGLRDEVPRMIASDAGECCHRAIMQ